MVRLTCIVDPVIVIPVGAGELVGGGVGLSGSSELTQEVKKEIPKVLITVAKPAFSINCLLEALSVPEFEILLFFISIHNLKLKLPKIITDLNLKCLLQIQKCLGFNSSLTTTASRKDLGFFNNSAYGFLCSFDNS